MIDNIFINVIEGNATSGLLVIDISDHLPVFTVLEINNTVKSTANRETTKLVRIKSPEAIRALKEELLNHDWQDVYVEDINESHGAFLATFLTFYHRHCPLKLYKQNFIKKGKPWLIKGLERACKKKNRLYREFIKYRTKEREDKYKKYKNRLTSIRRLQQKDYYNKLLLKHKNIKATNAMIKKCGKKSFPTYIVRNDKSTTEITEEIVNEFNDFFCQCRTNSGKRNESSYRR